MCGLLPRNNPRCDCWYDQRRACASSIPGQPPALRRPRRAPPASRATARARWHRALDAGARRARAAARTLSAWRGAAPARSPFAAPARRRRPCWPSRGRAQKRTYAHAILLLLLVNAAQPVPRDRPPARSYDRAAVAPQRAGARRAGPPFRELTGPGALARTHTCRALAAGTPVQEEEQLEEMVDPCHSVDSGRAFGAQER
jgi:hypothetical protein